MSSVASATPRRARSASAYRAFGTTVARVVRLSPSFVRVTLVGPDLADLGRAGLDQRIKLLLPTPTGRDPRTEDFEGDWYESWRLLPVEERNPMRTYSIRAIRGEGAATELDVDMVLHGTGPSAGPASRWASSVAPGARVVLNAPSASYDGPPVGLEFLPPPSTRRLVLAGDETAAPAICAILETLAPGTDAEAYVEIPLPDDALDVALPAGVTLTWLPRTPGLPTRHPAAEGGAVRLAGGSQVAVHDGAPLPHGARLDDAVRSSMAARAGGCPTCAAGRGCGLGHARVPDTVEDVDVDATILWDTPAVRAAEGVGVSPAEPTGAGDGCFAWIAGEAATVRALRRHLVTDLGVDRRQVAFMGYWRLGRAEN